MLPTHYDCRRGIRRWFSFGNYVWGDCTVAAYMHIVMVHMLASSSSWQRLLYRLGFNPQIDLKPVEEYTQFLATLNEKPSGTQGVDPGQFLAWEQSRGRVTEWQFIQVHTGGNMEDIIHQAMVDWEGTILCLDLTLRAYNNGTNRGPWELEPGDTPDPTLGHSIALVEYGPKYNDIITWGINKRMSYPFTEATVYGCWVFK